MDRESKNTFRKTRVIHSRYGWRSHRTEAALAGKQGLGLLTMEQLAARLAGGFLRPIDPDALKSAVKSAVSEPLGELDSIKTLPGFQRAAVASLSKAWRAGLKLDEEAAAAAGEAARIRLDSLALLERAVLYRLPANQLRPRDLAAAAALRAVHAPFIFGRIEIHGRTEMSPVWRRLLSLISRETGVVWVAEAREIPDWLHDSEIEVETAPKASPTVRALSCASPRHEVREALRWARQHLAQGALPQQIAIVATSPENWDDHMLALGEACNLPLHFIHGRTVLSTTEGQLAAALAEILLRGFSRARVVRLAALLRSQNQRFNTLPGNWWQVLPDAAPLLDATRWRRAITEMGGPDSPVGDCRPLLEEIIGTLARGRKESETIGERLLAGRALRIWRKALLEGPAAALDITLTGLRVDDGLEPGASMVWGPASAIAAAPRPFCRLLGLTSRSWPRRANEDSLLPNHVVPADRLDPLPVHEADRRDFETILRTAGAEVVCSRARRDSEGRLNGISPLYPHHFGETHLAQSREPEHAASASDRFVARPAEFRRLPHAISARETWRDWHRRQLTAHDGLVRRSHPLLVRSLDRCQSASSLVKLLRDPLGYLWTYGFGWRAPEETDEPLTLDALAFGSLLHDILQETVARLEEAPAGSFAGASAEEIEQATRQAADQVRDRWDDSRPVPPPVVWIRKCKEAEEMARGALTLDEQTLPEQRSWVEVPFGGGPRLEDLDETVRSRLPWDPGSEVRIPRTNIRINGFIDRLDLAGDRSRARVTDYKSGKPSRQPPQIRGGSELQRCLYAFAVGRLISPAPQVDTRLLYPRDGGSLCPLDEPDETLEKLADYLVAASVSFAQGNSLPGPAATETWYGLAFALPGGSKESYLEVKRPLADRALASIAPLWEEP